MDKQEWLEKELENFKVNLKKAADESFDKWYSDFLPYIEADYTFNVQCFAENEIRYFLEDKPENQYPRKVTFHDYNGKQIRAKIFEENKEELIDLLNKDLLKQVEDLKISLENSYRRY